MIRRRLIYWVMFSLAILSTSEKVDAWEWSDLVGGNLDFTSTRKNWLTYEEVTELRVRDIKRRLARHHGFSADELGRMLDKKELIQALAFEEEKERLETEANMKRSLLKQGVVISILSVLLVMCWPLLRHAWEVIHVNFVVYTDRKKLEASKCWELQTYWGMFLILLMFFVDLLQFWLSASILLSWVMRSKYFFPVPSLPIRPAQLMGGQLSQSSLANYGINVGPMVITWILRFMNARLGIWTGKAMSRAQKEKRRAARASETPEERASRRYNRKQAKKEARERTAAAAATAAASAYPPPPSSWNQYQNQDRSAPVPPPSKMHDEFVKEVETNSLGGGDESEFEDVTSGFDELD